MSFITTYMLSSVNFVIRIYFWTPGFVAVSLLHIGDRRSAEAQDFALKSPNRFEHKSKFQNTESVLCPIFSMIINNRISLGDRFPSVNLGPYLVLPVCVLRLKFNLMPGAAYQIRINASTSRSVLTQSCGKSRQYDQS